MVKDDIGIYYDATMPSKLENLLNTYEFKDEEIKQAKKAIELIKNIKLASIITILISQMIIFKKMKKGF